MIKVVESTNNEKLKQFVDGIDFDKLNDYVGKLLKKDVNLVPGEVQESGSYIYLHLEDPTNYADQCGIMSPLYKKVNVDTFNGQVSINKETGEYFYWCTVHFSFEYVTGGRNGTEICRAQWNGNEWMFKSEVEEK